MASRDQDLIRAGVTSGFKDRATLARVLSKSVLGWSYRMKPRSELTSEVKSWQDLFVLSHGSVKLVCSGTNKTENALLDYEHQCFFEWSLYESGVRIARNINSSKVLDSLSETSLDVLMAELERPVLEDVIEVVNLMRYVLVPILVGMKRGDLTLDSNNLTDQGWLAVMAGPERIRDESKLVKHEVARATRWQDTTAKRFWLSIFTLVVAVALGCLALVGMPWGLAFFLGAFPAIAAGNSLGMVAEEKQTLRRNEAWIRENANLWLDSSAVWGGDATAVEA